MQMTHWSFRRQEMLPPLPSTYPRFQSLWPAATISFRIAMASGERKAASAAGDETTAVGDAVP